MDDLISRTELLDRLNKAEKIINDTYVDDVATRMILAISRVKIIIKAMPSAEWNGHWINHRCDDGHHIADCSECGNTLQWYDDDGGHNYCPNCGAKMERRNR